MSNERRERTWTRARARECEWRRDEISLLGNVQMRKKTAWARQRTRKTKCKIFQRQFFPSCCLFLVGAIASNCIFSNVFFSRVKIKPYFYGVLVAFAFLAQNSDTEMVKYTHNSMCFSITSVLFGSIHNSHIFIPFAKAFENCMLSHK